MALLGMEKEELKAAIITNVKNLSRKTIDQADADQIYQAVAFTIRDIIMDKWISTQKTYNEEDVKTVYYLSMEFLTGRFLGNNILNLSMYNEFMEVLDELGVDYNAIEEAEDDPGLGNGGLGRLAACFMDSLATLEYPAYGCGIRYHYGIFEQKIVDGYQVERPDNWLEKGDIWGVRRKEYAYEVKFGGNVRGVKKEDGNIAFSHENAQSVIAIPYDYPIIGYGCNTVNTLRLWDAEAKNKFDLQSFNAGNYSKAVEEQNLASTLTEVLYPADEHYEGKALRLKQQYFFISATVQRVIERYAKMHPGDFSKLPELVQFQLNDTHPSVAVAECMRVLMDEYSLDWDDAWELTTGVCSYTNHTIMSEALEKWPVELFSSLLPRIYMIVEEINRRFCAQLLERYGNDHQKISKMAIIADGQIRMAHLAIVGSHSVNGVAALHSKILMEQELKDFYDIYPKKFNNKTNGITQRRWLYHCNPELANFITGKIGDGWVKDLSQLKNLVPYSDDQAYLDEFMRIKRNNKVKLSNYILAHNGIQVDPDSIFDVQIKRLHEYKRQLLNILHVLYLYNELKINPNNNMQPRTFIFAAKASASYHRAKLIIKLINTVADLVNNDDAIGGKLKVLFMENYRVSLAEKLIPAADISEQISTAGKEASGTGNMKFMLNGAVTLGTMDGANVEIYEEVGEDNIFIFGARADEIQRLSASGSYNPWYIYNLDQNVRLVLTQLINGTLSPNTDLFRELYESLLNGYNGNRPDEYFILQDFDAYRKAHEDVDAAYQDKKRWAKMASLNTACSGKFSSDRTIEQYAQEIWQLKKVPIQIGE